MSGLDKLIPIPFGTLYVIVNAILLIFSLVADRHNIGIATFINPFLLGYITQFTLECLQKLFPAPSRPDRTITRAEAAAIATRMVKPSLRIAG